jgi:hypothetical protein
MAVGDGSTGQALSVRFDRRNDALGNPLRWRMLPVQPDRQPVRGPRGTAPASGGPAAARRERDNTMTGTGPPRSGWMAGPPEDLSRLVSVRVASRLSQPSR